MARVADATQLIAVDAQSARRGLRLLVTVGGLIGLAWAAGLRGFTTTTTMFLPGYCSGSKPRLPPDCR